MTVLDDRHPLTVHIKSNVTLHTKEISTL